MVDVFLFVGAEGGDSADASSFVVTDGAAVVVAAFRVLLGFTGVGSEGAAPRCGTIVANASILQLARTNSLYCFSTRYFTDASGLAIICCVAMQITCTTDSSVRFMTAYHDVRGV